MIPSIAAIRRKQAEYGVHACPECEGDMTLFYNGDVAEYEEHCSCGYYDTVDPDSI